MTQIRSTLTRLVYCCLAFVGCHSSAPTKTWADASFTIQAVSGAGKRVYEFRAHFVEQVHAGSNISFTLNIDGKPIGLPVGCSASVGKFDILLHGLLAVERSGKNGLVSVELYHGGENLGGGDVKRISRGSFEYIASGFETCGISMYSTNPIEVDLTTAHQVTISTSGLVDGDSVKLTNFNLIEYTEDQKGSVSNVGR